MLEKKIRYVTKGYSTSVLFYMLFAIEATKAKKIITVIEYENYKKHTYKKVQNRSAC
jgi:hypothetical protein